MTDDDTLQAALRHVLAGRQIVANQHARIARLKEKGKPTADQERLLHSFEDSLRIFEEHYGQLLAERQTDPQEDNNEAPPRS